VQVTIHEAKTNLSKLLVAVARGEQVVIARGTEPIAELVPFKRPKICFGLLAHVAPPPEDFFDPLTDEELARWEGRE
jgi:prevent-host-death family protein